MTRNIQINKDINSKIKLLSKSFGFDVCKVTKPEISIDIKKNYVLGKWVKYGGLYPD
mgnify:CR=1